MRRKRESRKATRGHSVFISHATSDKFIAVAMCKLLEDAGIRTFRDDRDISGGDDIPDSLRIAITHADELVVLLTPNSVNRAWVMLEIGAAWALERARIVPVLYNVTVDLIPALLKSRKAVHLNEFHRYVEELLARTKGQSA